MKNFTCRKLAKAIVKSCILLIAGIVIGAVASGCSALQPSSKSQSMTVTALGFPAVTVVTTSSQSATNSGDDEGENTQTVTNDVKPDLDATVR